MAFSNALPRNRNAIVGGKEQLTANMDDSHRRQMLFGTTPHRRPVSTSTTVPTYPTNPSGGMQATTELEMMENSNDIKVDNLRGNVGDIRYLALTIGDEIRDQNDMIDNMAGNFENAGEKLTRTIAFVRRLASSSASFHICMLFLIAFVFFFLIYLLIP